MTCGLQFAYSCDPAFSNILRKSNTFAALGTIAHELTELIWKRGINDTPIEDLKRVLEKKWDEYAQSSYEKLCGEWDGRDVPPPKDWPYFSMTRARTIRRLVNEVTEHRSNLDINRQVPRPLIETELVDELLRLKGIPDRVTFRDDGFFVFDIKTGHAIEEISMPYRRQLLLYAHLVKKHTGLEPLAVALIRAGGDVIWEDVTSADIEDCVADVMERINRYSKIVKTDPLSLASPSPDACRFCDYKAICTAFWEDQDTEWEEHRGVVGEVVEVIDESTFRVRQIWPQNDEGREVGVSNVPFHPSVGDHVSIVDGYLRDGGLRGNWYTKILKIS
jgi:CRISPR/Cas system-associated exonuclease Cas4 (RecB family)